MMTTVTACITTKCTRRCMRGLDGYSCVAGCNQPGKDRETELDFSYLVKWMNEFFPKQNLHISGGEPLTHSGLVKGIMLCCDAGFCVTLFTNADILEPESELFKLPIKWHVTFHKRNNDMGAFMRRIDRISKKSHVVCEIFPRGKERPRFGMFSGSFNAEHIEADTGYHGFKPSVDSENPNEEILLIGTDGSVFNCSNPQCGTVGNIYDMTFDREAADSFRCPSGKFARGECQAYQSHKLMEGLR